MKCDVCGSTDGVEVFASTMGPVSLAYCAECQKKRLEPYEYMVAYISCAGNFPEDINEAYVDHVRRILKELDISEEKFIADCKKSEEEFNSLMDSMGE